MKRIIKYLLVMTLMLVVSKGYAGQQITVAVAANVQYAMKDIKAAFKKETGIDLNVVISSSGKLAAQIMQGAPYDIFVSANMMYPDSLYSKGFAVNAPRVYAEGSLVLWTMNSHMQLNNNLKMLTGTGIGKIALANPQTAPYGVAAVQTLKSLHLYAGLKDKLVYGESIAQTDQYIVSDVAGVGFTAKSVVLSPQMKHKGHWIALDKHLYQPIYQGAVILKYSTKSHKAAAVKFYDFLFSPEAQHILKEYGYDIHTE